MWSVHVLGEFVTMERVPGAVGITGSKDFNTGLDFVLPLVPYICPEDNFGGYSVLFCHTTIKSFLQILAKGWFDTWSRILMNQLGPWKTSLYVYLPTPCFTSKIAHRWNLLKLWEKICRRKKAKIKWGVFNHHIRSYLSIREHQA